MKPEVYRDMRAMESLFRDFFGDSMKFVPGNRCVASNKRQALSDVYETESAVIATFELPGVEKKDINLNINERMIEVSVKKAEKKELKDKDVKAVKQESREFYKIVQLPKQIVPQKADAEYKDGLLRIEAPKKERLEKIKVEIK